MPTKANGFPQVGEIWERNGYQFKVLSRGSGSYFSLKLEVIDPMPFKGQIITDVDAAFYFDRGEYKYVRG